MKANSIDGGGGDTCSDGPAGSRHDRPRCAGAAAGKKLVRIATARAVNFVALWGIAPFADKYGMRVKWWTHHQRRPAALDPGRRRRSRLARLPRPAIMAEQNVSNIKVISGIYLGGQNLIMRKGVDFKAWKDLKARRSAALPAHLRRSYSFLRPRPTT